MRFKYKVTQILPKIYLSISLALLIFTLALLKPEKALAAASLYISAPGQVYVGDTVTITVSVNTGGQAANAFEGNISYPGSLLEGVRGNYTGSICTLPITQPEPSGGGATFSCGTPSGYTGTGKVATVVFTATASGTASFGLSGCSVLANDGAGTSITGGCSGASTTVLSKGEPTPPPAVDPAQPASTTPAAAAATAKPKATPTPKPSGTAKPAETSKTTPPPTDPTPPPVEALVATPTPEGSTETPAAAEATPATDSNKRSMSEAVRDVFASLKNVKKIGTEITGMLAILLLVIPALGLALAIAYLIYRLYILERRRKKTLDRLFEMELSEFAALEGKLSLLSGNSKDKAQYMEEFRKSKENILKQLKPDFGKDKKDVPAMIAEEAEITK